MKKLKKDKLSVYTYLKSLYIQISNVYTKVVYTNSLSIKIMYIQ